MKVFQWSAIALVLVALVGLNYDFDSEAGMRMNAPLDDPLSQGLRGYWKMDEGTGTSTTADSSGNGNTLSMTGPPTWTTGTIGPSAMDFSGSGQYLSVASPASGVLDFASGANFSITGWFNRDTFDYDHTIVAKRNGQTATDDGYIVYIDDSTDTLVFEASDTADTDEYQRVSTAAFTETGWHQFAVTWNDAATTDPVNIFIDGALNNGTATGTFANIGDLTESVAFRIGAESDAGNPFDGKIDDVRVYSYPLSAGEVSKLYQTTAPTQPVDTGLVGHWTFDGPDIKGATAIDRSSFGNNGTITGAVPTIGKLGQGMRFDGDDDAVDTANSVSWTGAFAFSFWVWTLGGNDDNLLGWGAYKICRVNLFGVSFDGIGCTVDADVYAGVQSSSPIDDRWHHVVYTGNASTQYLYVDGILEDTGSETAETSSDIFTMGYRIYSSMHANAKLDDVRFYSRILSQTEVTDLYKMGK